jgi:hypothetical protein
MIPTQAQTIIERSFYEALRLKAVEYGYTPDITQYANTSAGTLAYNNALKAIRLEKGFAVEIFGSSIPGSKGMEDLPRISISPQSFVPGDIGVQTGSQTIEVDDHFETIQSDGMVFRYFLTIVVSVKSSTELREVTNIVHAGLPLRGFLKAYDDSVDDFLVHLISSGDESGEINNMIEKSYRYEIPDVTFLEGVSEDFIAPIEETILNVEISHRLGIN